MECQGSNCPSPGGAGAGTQIQASVFTVVLFGLVSLLVLWMQYSWKRKPVSMQEQSFHPKELLKMLCSSWIFLNCEIMKDDHAIILNKQKLIHEIFRILILFPSKKFDKRFITNHITESVLSTVWRKILIWKWIWQYYFETVYACSVIDL